MAGQIIARPDNHQCSAAYPVGLALPHKADLVSGCDEIVGTSPALQAVLSGVIKVARTDSTVLIKIGRAHV